MRWTSGLLTKLLRQTSGNILPLTAVAIFVVAALVGGGVDASRAYKVHNRLQSACDAAVLAGRRAVSSNGFDTAAEREADDYFDVNFDDANQGVSGTLFTPSSNDNGNTVNGAASTTMQTAVMSLFGVDSVDLSVNCAASMSLGNSDVVMVLDTTGSMGGYISYSQTRLQALQAAMKNFYDTVALATQGSNARVRYGFVPYSSSVNVGRLIYAKNPDYLVDTYKIQSREPVYKTITVEEFDHWDSPVYSSGSGSSSISYSYDYQYSGTRYSKSNSCEDDLPDDEGWSNYGSSSTDTETDINRDGQRVTTTTVSQSQRAKDYFCVRQGSGWGGKYYQQYYRYMYRNAYQYQYATEDPVYTSVETHEFDHFLYKQVTYDTSNYKAFSSATTQTGNNGSDVNSTWGGCIEERKTVAASNFSYSKLLGYSPSGVYDLDIDMAPDPSDDDTKWAPMWPEVSYYRTSWVSSYYGGSYNISDVTTSLTGGKASSNCPQAAKLLGSMTKSEFYAYANSLYAQGNTYHDLGMIWGGRLSSPDGIFSANVTEEPANGGKVARHIIFMTDGQMEPNYQIQSSYGIEFHDRRVTDDGRSNDASRHTARFRAVCDAVKAKGIRIWVIAFGASLTTDLEACASSDSAFTASNADQLNDAFQEIAKNVGELRVTL
ncbi:hypothetical protein MB02_03150 [Croceicoccus estronivorus]|uniref:TadE/TadG family type IV pilus assembly protein n=1 Tax=Croceicoccus estronivorus TaxID=1172626 RepID=UPI00082BFD18|nr:pilus assembly protein TadG-related protein [Croceicoccus estronivorus]OCC24503.1 hypothetical protein MB02_03150 [Croceicoccus estronivorus]